MFITAERDIEISTPRDLILSGSSININVTNDISQGTSGNYTISGKKIFIGASPNDTTQPMVLGGELAGFLEKLINVFTTLLPLTTVITPTGPGTVVFAPLISGLKALQTVSLLGVPESAIFNSTSNFTSKTNS